MVEINNLNKLTDKIYQEGIEEAKMDSLKILSQAEAEARKLLDNANNEARGIVALAKKEAQKIARSTEKEVQLKGMQLISDLKEAIQNTLSKKILVKDAKDAFADDSFLKSCILEAISSWKPSDDLELVLSKELESKLEAGFLQSTVQHFRNLTITFNNRLDKGFRIIEKTEGYQISFSEDDFIILFSSYLNKQTRDLLFSQPA